VCVCAATVKAAPVPWLNVVPAPESVPVFAGFDTDGATAGFIAPV
jgi:hypothetical protein